MNTLSLFDPGCIGKVTLKNRLAVAPMTRVTASEDGVAGDRMQAYYADFTRGGFGLVISEGIYIDRKWSQTYAFQAGLTSAEQAAGWRKVTDAVHQQDGRIFAQIQHSGALSQGNYFLNGTVAPSAVRPTGKQMTFYRGEGEYPVPRELSDP